MSGLFFRSLFVSVVLSFLLTISLLGLGSYLLFFLGSDGLLGIQKTSENMGLELGSALARMAGERLSNQKDVELSATMAKTVSRSKNKYRQNVSSFKIDEIFLLDKDGIPLAHSDVALMAKDSVNNYKDSKYSELLSRENKHTQSVYKIYAMDESRVAPDKLYESIREASPELAAWLTLHYPEKIIQTYRLSLAVYQVDELSATGSLHLIIKSDSVNRYLQKLNEHALFTIIWVVSSVFLISTFVFFLLILTYFGPFKKLKNRNVPQSAVQPVSQIAESVEVDEGPTAAELAVMEDANQLEKSDLSNVTTVIQSQAMSLSTNETVFETQFHTPLAFSEEDDIYDAIPLEINATQNHASEPEQ